MTDASLGEDPAAAADDVVGREAGRLVDDDQAVDDGPARGLAQPARGTRPGRSASRMAAKTSATGRSELNPAAAR